MNKEKLLGYINNKIKEKEAIEHNIWVNGYIQSLEILKKLIEVGVFDNE